MGNRFGLGSLNYGIGSYQQAIYDSFDWIRGDTDVDMTDEKEQLIFLHENIFYLINGEKESLNYFVREWGIERGLSYQEMLTALGEMYHVITKLDFKIK